MKSIKTHKWLASEDRSEPHRASLDLLTRAIAIIAVVYFFIHSALVITGTERRVMNWLYDDAFYYLIVAKHFSEAHISSFDGVTVTSGYHPLWMWICSFVFGIRSKLDLTYVRSCMGITTSVSLGLLVVGLLKGFQSKDGGWLWAIALGATSYSALNNGVTVMEWPLVLLCWACLHGLLLYQRSNALEGGTGNDHMRVALAFLVGIAGSLSRSDFGLIPACYLAAAVFVGWKSREWRFNRLAGAGLAGSIVGLLSVFLYIHAFTGSWIQQSAKVKRLAASLSDPFNPVPACWQFLRVLLYLPRLDLETRSRVVVYTFAIPILCLLGLGCFFVIFFKRRLLLERIQNQLQTNAEEVFVLTASLLGVVGYLFVYSFNSQATYGWYTGTVTGFMLLLFAKFFSFFRRRTQTVLGLLLVLSNIATGLFTGGNAESQYHENSIGRLLLQNHAGARMGGGDVGKPSFYNGGTMFNLDGLMNDEVVPYLVAGTVHCYIAKRGIAYLSNVGSITEAVTDAERARLGRSALPWKLYFPMIEGVSPTGYSVSYVETNFAAIRDSGECEREIH